MSEETRKSIMHSEIAEYWSDKAITMDGEVVAENPSDNSIIPMIRDIGEPECWACGKMVDVEDMPTYQKSKGVNIKRIYDLAKVRSKLNRCHIVPHALGGSDDDPGNFVLLCERCHKDAPDTENPKNMLRWLYDQRSYAFTDDGINLTTIMDMVRKECDKRGKDPMTGDASKINVTSHGSHLSLSTIVYAYVDTCKTKEAHG